MFSEWTDPYDIDNYYNDLNGVMRDIQASPSGSMYQQLPTSRPSTLSSVEMKPEPPTGVVINPTQQKSNFEVDPGSIFMDGHPVGRQPPYNILRSGPPDQFKKENYIANNYMMTPDWTLIIMFFCIVILGCLLIQSRMQISNMKLKMDLLCILKNMTKAMRKCNNLLKNICAKFF